MPDTVVSKSSQSCLSRLVGSILGIGIGLLLVIVAFPVLWWNEGRSVHRARALEEGAAIVVHVSADAAETANDGKLVHLTGLATTTQTLTDPDFGISAPAIRLNRIAETYQWKESSKSSSRKKLGGGTETTTTYTYSKAWSSTHHDSSAFHSPEGHENPPALEWESRMIAADAVTCGAFKLSPDLVGMIGGAVARDVAPDDAQGVRAAGFAVAQNGFYKGADPASPQVGDVRVRFEVAQPRTVSIVAAQLGSGLETYYPRAGSKLLMLKDGQVSATEMFKAEESANALMKWLLRGGGLLGMFLGFVLILRPLSVVGGVVPIVGRLVAAGTGMVSFAIALALSLATIALAWVAYRPLIGGGLMLVVAAVLVLYARWHRANTPRAVVPPPIPPPIPPSAPTTGV